jgi:methionyl-tRNA formyltransferase
MFHNKYANCHLHSTYSDAGFTPNQLVKIGKALGYGALALTDVQLAGKKRMDVKAFLLGFREPETYTTSKGTSKGEILKTKPQEEE